MKRLSLFLLLLVFGFFIQAVYAGSGGTAKGVTLGEQSDTTNAAITVQGGNVIDGAGTSLSVQEVDPVVDAWYYVQGGTEGAYLGSTYSTTWSPWYYTGSTYAYLYTSATYSVSVTSSTTTNKVPPLTLSGSTIANDLISYTATVRQPVYTDNAHYWRTDDYYQIKTVTRTDWFAIDPLILDLDGTGEPDVANHVWLPHTPFFHREGSVVFDLSGEGTPVLTEWLGPHSGFLCVPDKNGNVTSGKDIFGTYGGFEDGYEKLSLRDKNHDGKIEGDELKGLYVWRDSNGNGKVDPGELTSVQDLGITSISLQQHNYESTYVRNGKTYKTWDWWPTSMRVAPVKNANQL